VPIGTDKPIFTSCDKLDWVTTSSSWPRQCRGDRPVRCHQQHQRLRVLVLRPQRHVQLPPLPQPRYQRWYRNGRYPCLPLPHQRMDQHGEHTAPACETCCSTCASAVVWRATTWSSVQLACSRSMRHCAACPRVKVAGQPCRHRLQLRREPHLRWSQQREQQALCRGTAAHPPWPAPACVTSSVSASRVNTPTAGSCIVRPRRPALAGAELDQRHKLKCNTQYEVDVRVSKDGGATWCLRCRTHHAACADTDGLGQGVQREHQQPCAEAKVVVTTWW
jgi:hypothetical protein